MTSSRPAIIICEKGFRWTAAWRRCNVAGSTHVVTVDSLSAVDERFQLAAGSFVVAEGDEAGMPDLLEWLTRQLTDHREIAVAVVGGSGLRMCRYELMERGALLVATSERQLPAVCAAAQRHASRWRPRALALRERIRDRLPWGDVHLPGEET
jgi:hexokinase